MKRCYPIVLHKDPESDFGVTVPDFPGCFSAGSTVEEALEMSREAILGHAEVMRDFGQNVPNPTPIHQLLGNPDFADGIWAIVSVDLMPGKEAPVAA